MQFKVFKVLSRCYHATYSFGICGLVNHIFTECFYHLNYDNILIFKPIIHQGDKYYISQVYLQLSNPHCVLSDRQHCFVSTVCFICLKGQRLCFILCTLTGFHADNFLPSVVLLCGEEVGLFVMGQRRQEECKSLSFLWISLKELPQEGGL